MELSEKEVMEFVEHWAEEFGEVLSEDEVRGLVPRIFDLLLYLAEVPASPDADPIVEP